MKDRILYIDQYARKDRAALENGCLAFLGTWLGTRLMCIHSVMAPRRARSNGFRGVSGVDLYSIGKELVGTVEPRGHSFRERKSATRGSRADRGVRPTTARRL